MMTAINFHIEKYSLKFYAEGYFDEKQTRGKSGN
jgi:hypothetical protein